MTDKLNPFFKAISLFRRRKFDKAAEECSKILEKNPYDKASMLSFSSDSLVNLARLNADNYGNDWGVRKALFQYLLQREGDVRTALQLAAVTTKACDFQDWHCKVQLGVCYHRWCKTFVVIRNSYFNGGLDFRLGMFRDAEKQFVSALKQQQMVDTVLLLGKVYIRLDQPLTAIEQYRSGLEHFPNDVSLLVALARIFEELENLDESVHFYEKVLKQDATNIEAIACIGANYFYSDQPEIALRYYRRILQMGVNNAQLFTNIGLCCFYSQQFDLAIGCLERAHTVAEDDVQADVWYNISHVALATGDVLLAYRCLRLALVANSEHIEAYCNLGVLEMRKGRLESAKTLLQKAMTLGSFAFEPFFNFALVCFNMGDYQSSFSAVRRSLELFTEHDDSQTLMNRIQIMFTGV